MNQCESKRAIQHVLNLTENIFVIISIITQFGENELFLCARLKKCILNLQKGSGILFFGRLSLIDLHMNE